MSPAQRATYLDWLADGRKDGDLPVGYAFVFFYGLERRLLEGKNRPQIRDELLRLLGLFGDNRSFRTYVINLQTFDVVRNLWDLTPSEVTKFVPLSVHRTATTREALSVTLASFSINEEPLPAALAFETAKRHPQSTNSVVLDRARDESKHLFAQKYKRKYGDGLQVTAPSHKQLEYKPASSSVSKELRLAGENVDLRVPYPDPLATPGQFAGSVEILEECIDELRSYSREVRDSSDEDLTVEKWQALPIELQREVPHPKQSKWDSMIGEHLGDDGIVRLTARKLLEFCELPQRDTLKRTQCRKIADVAQGMGFSIEPDPYLLPQTWEIDDGVALIQSEYTSDSQRPVFKVGALLVYLALYIASADNQVDASELEVINRTIEDMLDLRSDERRRLEALSAALVNADQNMRGVSKRISENFEQEHREVLANLLLRVAAADNELDSSEETYLERAFDALGLDPDEGIRRVQQAVEPDDQLESPRTVRQGEETEGERIPPRDAPTDSASTDESSVTLDSERIAQIKRETRDVAELLGNEIGDRNERPATSSPSPEGTSGLQSPENEDGPDGSRDEDTSGLVAPSDASSKEDGEFVDLDERYHPFVRDLQSRSEWTPEEYRNRAREYGLMAAAATSAINEWADEKYSEFLIRESDVYEIRTELIEEDYG
jgi:uncharacterized tellurite resistance protein B-like protein/pimeloyl-ACP methyl ester carboxylesterase